MSKCLDVAIFFVYSDVPRSEYQMFQSLQLFAHHFPEYDYFWTIEMDVRFTEHTGTMLSSLTRFARNEPRKQARQRMSHYFIPSVYGTYDNFTSSVDSVLDHGDAYYTGVRIPDIPAPIGEKPPHADPNEDPFEWGVGEEADFMTFSPCNNVTLHNLWLYYDWIYGFSLGLDTPGRLICPVTISRTSWNLLNAVHNHQIGQALRVQSESTMASFALWHGLKISLPPLPMYSRKDAKHTTDEVLRFVNGGLPSRERDGMATGEWVYAWDGDGEEYLQHTSIFADIDITYRFMTPYPQELWEVWMKGLDGSGNDGGAAGLESPGDDHEQDPDRGAGADDTEQPRFRSTKRQGYDADFLPTLMVRDGKVYLPNTMMHPVKTNIKAP